MVTESIKQLSWLRTFIPFCPDHSDWFGPNGTDGHSRNVDRSVLLALVISGLIIVTFLYLWFGKVSNAQEEIVRLMREKRYLYKSPDLDSNVNFEDSAFKGRESKKDEEREKLEVNCPIIRSRDEADTEEKLLRTCYGDDKHKNQWNFHPPKPKDLDTFSSHSVLLSEPPDIRNWFSSYVYESPMSGTSSQFEDSVSSKENGCEIQGKDEHKVIRVNVVAGESSTHNSFSNTSMRANQLSSRPFTEKEVLPSIYALSESQDMQNFRQALSGPRQIFSLLNPKRLKMKKKAYSNKRVTALEAKVKEQGEMITEMRALLQSKLNDKGTRFPPGGNDDTGDDPD